MNYLLTRCSAFIAIFLFTNLTFAEIEAEHDSENNEAILLTSEQISTAGIKIEVIEAATRTSTLYAPAEIMANAYTSYVVSPRVESLVIKRHVSLGELVEEGQPLVTLFSESIAKAQADYRIQYAEWKRIQKLGVSVVSEKNISEAQTRYIAAEASLKAFGLTHKAIEQLTTDNSSSLGEYTLEAIQSGSVLEDDFQQGQHVDAGQALMTLVNANTLWVEARLSANTKTLLPVGSVATLTVDELLYEAKVIQESHTIDLRTRTRVVRLSIQNDEHLLHPGMFGSVYFNIDTKQPVLAVPETALILGADGDWLVFIEDHAGGFIPKEVVLGKELGSYRQISGIRAGIKVVTEGAFFIASEQAKNGFDPHNH